MRLLPRRRLRRHRSRAGTRRPDPPHGPPLGECSIAPGIGEGVRNGPSATAGFSLLELLVVLVISGILLSLAAPRLERFITRLELDTAANTVIADLYYARMLAVREGRDVAVRFQRMSRSPRCYSPAYEVVIVGAPERVAKRQDLGGGIARACLDVGAVAQVRFGPRGLPNGAMNRTVRIARGGQEARFRLSLLGRVYRDY